MENILMLNLFVVQKRFSDRIKYTITNEKFPNLNFKISLIINKQDKLNLSNELIISTVKILQII